MLARPTCFASLWRTGPASSVGSPKDLCLGPASGKSICAKNEKRRESLIPALRIKSAPFGANPRRFAINCRSRRARGLHDLDARMYAKYVFIRYAKLRHSLHRRSVTSSPRHPWRTSSLGVGRSTSQFPSGSFHCDRCVGVTSWQQAPSPFNPYFRRADSPFLLRKSRRLHSWILSRCELAAVGGK